MSYPLFRLRTVLCALSVGVLSACGGGGDDLTGDAAILASDINAELAPRPSQMIVLKTSSTVKDGVYNANLTGPDCTKTGDIKMGHSKFTSDAGVTLTFGYAEGHKEKFLLLVEVAATSADRSPELYQCISANWTDAEKTLFQNPPVCGSGVFFDGTSNQLTLRKASIPGASGKRVGLNVQIPIPEANFTAPSFCEVPVQTEV